MGTKAKVGAICLAAIAVLAPWTGPSGQLVLGGNEPVGEMAHVLLQRVKKSVKFGACF